MGHACSAEKEKNKTSQKRDKEYASKSPKENTNEHYMQGNIAASHQSNHQAENKSHHHVSEKVDKNENPNPLNRPENEIEKKNNDDVNNIEEFSKAKAQQDLSFELEKEIEQVDEKPYAKSAKDDHQKPEYSKNEGNSFGGREEEKNQDNPDNLFAKNLGHQQIREDPTAEAECPICLESYAILRQDPTFTTCGHAFCSKCLKGALKIHPYCPLCRTYQSRPLNDAQGQRLYDLNEEAPLEPLPQEEWNVEVVRAHLRAIPGEEGELNRRVYLSNGEATNIFVGKSAKINIAPTANLFINGKRVENPQDCNVQ